MRRDEEALAAAEEALQLSPGELWIVSNKAHALMYLERTAQAMRIYLEHKGKPAFSHTWDKGIADDFAELKAAGRAHPLMDRVLQDLGAEQSRKSTLKTSKHGNQIPHGR